MDRSLSLQAARLLADARESMAEWIEEGIDTWQTASEPKLATREEPAFEPSPEPIRTEIAAKPAEDAFATAKTKFMHEILLLEFSFSTAGSSSSAPATNDGIAPDR